MQHETRKYLFSLAKADFLTVYSAQSAVSVKTNTLQVCESVCTASTAACCCGFVYPRFASAHRVPHSRTGRLGRGDGECCILWLCHKKLLRCCAFSVDMRSAKAAIKHILQRVVAKLAWLVRFGLSWLSIYHKSESVAYISAPEMANGA